MRKRAALMSIFMLILTQLAIGQEPPQSLTGSSMEAAHEEDFFGTFVWSVKFTCGNDPDFRLGLFFTDIEIHNPGTQPVMIHWKTVKEPDQVVASGIETLAPNGVLESACGEPPFQMPFGMKGFVEIESYHKLQVVAIYKNLEFSETTTEKGFRIPFIPINGEGGKDWAYSSEFICGNAASRKPASFQDIFDLLTEEELPKVWRPGFVWSNIRAQNPTRDTVDFSYRIIDAERGEVARSGWERISAGSGVKLDCSLVPESILNEGALDGFLVIEATSELLSVTFDKEDYTSHITASMDVEYIEPMKKKKKREFHH